MNVAQSAIAHDFCKKRAYTSNRIHSSWILNTVTFIERTERTIMTHENSASFPFNEYFPWKPENDSEEGTV